MSHLRVCLNNLSPTFGHRIYQNLPSTGPQQWKYQYRTSNKREKRVRGVRNMVFGYPEYDKFHTDADIVLSLGNLADSNVPTFSLLENFFALSNNKHFWTLNRDSIRRRTLQILRKNNSQAILGLSEISKEYIISYLSPEADLMEKFGYIYPSIPNPFETKPRFTDHVRTFLFVSGSEFYGKGGKEFLVIAEQLLDKYPHLRFIMKAPVPKQILQRYKSRPEIKFVTQHISDFELHSLYQKSDVLLFPIYTTSTSQYLEAKFAGLPIITAGNFDIKEIVRDGIDGYVVQNPYGLFEPRDFYRQYSHRSTYLEHISKIDNAEMVRHMIKACVRLIENPAQAKKMSLAGFQDVDTGRFSISNRNKMLEDNVKRRISFS